MLRGRSARAPPVKVPTPAHAAAARAVVAVAAAQLHVMTCCRLGRTRAALLLLRPALLLVLRCRPSGEQACTRQRSCMHAKRACMSQPQAAPPCARCRCHAPLLVHVGCVCCGGVVSVIPLVHTHALDLRGGSCTASGKRDGQLGAARCSGCRRSGRLAAVPPRRRRPCHHALRRARRPTLTCAHRGRLPPRLSAQQAEGRQLPAREGALQGGGTGRRHKRAHTTHRAQCSTQAGARGAHRAACPAARGCDRHARAHRGHGCCCACGVRTEQGGSQG